MSLLCEKQANVHTKYKGDQNTRFPNNKTQALNYWKKSWKNFRQNPKCRIIF